MHYIINDSYVCSQGICIFCPGCVSFVRDLIKLASESFSSLPGLADAYMKHKRFRFDGHVGMLQLRVLVSRQISTRIDHTDTDPSVGRCLNTQSLQTVRPLWFRNCGESRKLRLFLRLLPACVSPAGIPSWLRPRQWSNSGVIFFSAFFGRITVKAPHAAQALQKCSFWHRNSWKSAKPPCILLLSWQEGLWRRQTLKFFVIQFLLIIKGAFLLKRSSNTT